MSKKAQARAKLKRQKDKRARKQQKVAQYTAWRDTGVTKSSRRARNRAVAEKKVSKSGKTKIPFPYHLWCDKQGNLLPGSPHKAYLSWVAV